MHQTVFVINPGAGSGRGLRVWRRLLREHPELADAPRVCASEPREARDALDELWHPALSRVVVLGGDGTLHGVANALLARGQPSTTAIALVPVGSGSDTAFGLGLARCPRRALQRALTQPARNLDALEIRHPDGVRYAVNVASIGISGAVAARINSQRRRWAGSYLWAALEMLARHRPSAVRVEVDGELWFEGPQWLLALANGKRFGRGMRIAPEARPDDGWMDVVLAEAVPARRLLPALPRLYAGAHLGLPFVRATRARNVRVEPLEALPPLEADGESLPGAAVEVELLPGVLPFVR